MSRKQSTMDDLKLRLLLQKQEFRKSEDERRRKLLEELHQPSYEQPASSFPFDLLETVTRPSEHTNGKGTSPVAAAAVASSKIDSRSEKKPYPMSVGCMHMKSSPSSSVSMSQSPTKLRPVVPPSKRLPESDSSSDEEDLMQYAIRIAQKKKSQSTSAASPSTSPVQASALVVGAAPSNAVSKGPQSKRQMLDNDSDSDDEFLLRANKERPSTAACTELSDSVPRSSPTTLSTLSDQSKDRKKVRNPLVLLREQNAAVAESLPPQNLFGAAVQDFWPDDEEEPLPRAKARKRPAKKSSPVIADPNQMDAVKIAKKRPAKIANEPKVSRKAARSLLPDAVVDDSIDEIEAAALKPEFDSPIFGPVLDLPPFILGGGQNGEETYEVPASIARYLPTYQREGIEFLYRTAIQSGKGAILGDDMGLGKTVQTIGLLAALFHKSGTGKDVIELNRRKRLAMSRSAMLESKQENALFPEKYMQQMQCKRTEDNPDLPAWSPVLIFAPCAVVTNWVEDFKTWAHFSVAVYDGTGNSREAALKSVEDGVTEVLVCGQSKLQDPQSFHLLNTAKVEWKLVIVDEFHLLKNEIGHMAHNIRVMRDQHQCVIVGLTGTLMQNDHTEMWNLVDLVAEDHYGPYPQFDSNFVRPIKLSRAKGAAGDVIELGSKRAVELSRHLYKIYLRRTKEEVLSDILPQKDERVIFCEPSLLQKELYKHIIEQPDFVLLRHVNAPCDCGVNTKFFSEYGHLRTQAEKRDYQRNHRDSLITRGQCCFPVPKLDGLDGMSTIDPGAVLWRQQHSNDVKCDRCPSCILFTAMSVLYKLCSHVALLQVKESPERLKDDEFSPRRIEAEKQLERAKQFIPSHLVSKLPGGYFRECGMMDDHFNLSGKMVILDKLLHAIQAQHGRVLIFSISTQSLDLIASHMASTGMSFLRMDGQTSTGKRKTITDKFKADASILAFLLSTKAMGTGLNLTQANFVIIFDVDWNPATDSQAQDRAYRIGQDKDVIVFRLVLRGTIEEGKYLRQIYKTQLQSETIVPVDDSDRLKAPRQFRGVAGDAQRKGELFGLENLLKYKDGTFMDYAAQEHESKKFGVVVHDTSGVLKSVEGKDEDELDAIGDDVELIGSMEVPRDGTRNVGGHNSSEEEDYELGGMSQAVMEICDANIPENLTGAVETAPISSSLERLQRDESERRSAPNPHGSIVRTHVKAESEAPPRVLVEMTTLPCDDKSETIQGYDASGETQSPMNIATFSALEEGPVGGTVECNHPCAAPKQSQATSGIRIAPRQAKPLNTRIAGVSTQSIRRGEAKKSGLYRPKK